MRHTRRHLARRGATAVEFAMTFPLLALLLLISTEYGWYFSQLAMVQAATNDAVRFAANIGPDGDPAVRASGVAGTLFSDLGFDCATLGCTITPTIGSTADLDTIELEVNVPYTQLTGILPSGNLTYVIPVPTTLRARAILPIVGP